jgi:hypothetical protein
MTRPSPRELALVTTLLTILAAIHLGMNGTRFFAAIAPDAGDPLFNLAILRWSAAQLAGAPGDLWSPPFFFPLRGTLALSDHLLGPAAAVAVLQRFGLPPAATYNSLLLAAFGLSGAAAHWVFRRSGLGFPGALLGALAWSFNAYRWSALSHLQVLLALWIPAALWAFDRLLAAPGGRRAAVFLLFYLLQLSCGVYLAYLLHFALAGIVLARVADLRRTWRDAAARRALLVAAGIAATTSAWLFLHYANLGRSLGLGPKFHEVLPNLITFASYLSVSPRTLYAPLWPESRLAIFPLWLGFVPLLLIVVGAHLRRRDAPAPSPARRFGRADAAFALGALALALRGEYLLRRLARRHEAALKIELALFAVALLALLAVWAWRRLHRPVPAAGDPDLATWWRGLVAIAAICAVVSYGPIFAALREVVPGLDAVRVPARFFAFTGFALAALAGRGLDRWLERLRARSARTAVAGAAIVLGLAAVESTPRRAFTDWIAAPALADAPPVYRWLAAHDEVAALVEQPMPPAWREAERMYFATLHGRPIVNGYSGTLPESYLALHAKLLDFPDRAVAGELARAGVSHLVLHVHQLSRRDRRAWQRWQKALERDPRPWMTRVAEQGSAVVYRIDRG